MAAVRRKHLSLVGPNHVPSDPLPDDPLAPLDPLDLTHPAVIGSMDDALTKGRAAVRILSAEPSDINEGYSLSETVALMNASDRLVEAFDAIDRLLSASNTFTM